MPNIISLIYKQKLYERFDYGKSLSGILKDRIVCGTEHERTQQSLLLSDSPSLELKAKLDTAKSLKSAIIQVIQNSATENDLESEVNSILKVTKNERNATVVVEIIW